MAAAGCRDCKMCTGHAFTGAGRSLGRGLADISTLGITHLARRTCKVCSHPMSEHLGKSAEMVVSATSDVRNEKPQRPRAPTKNPARWVEQSNGRFRWWDGYVWTNDYTDDPASGDPAAPAAAIESAPTASTPPAADPVIQLKQLAELRDAGILTEEEFAAKKAEILGRM